MVGIFENFTLRQIQSSDDTTKLSLGDASHTPYEIAKTYVIINQNLSPSRIWGYITLMNSEIVLNEGQRPQETSTTSRYEAFPAVKIARLAVDKSLRGIGLGSMFLDWCMNHIKLALMPHVGCRFLVVDAKRDSVAFYQKAGFTLLNINSNDTDEHPLMFFDLYKESELQVKNSLSNTMIYEL